MDAFEEFHITSNCEVSQRLVALLKTAGIQCRERALNESGAAEYAIDVQSGHLDRAREIFEADLGPGRTFTNRSR